MRKLSVFFVGLLLAVAVVGCDSAEDDPTDAELFVGTWTMVAFQDAEGDRMDDFNLIANGLTADLNADNTFAIDVDYKPETGREPLTVPGTYRVEEGDGSLVLVPPTGQEIPFQYDFDGDDRVLLSTNAAFINGLFGTDAYSGTVTLTIEK